VTGFANRLIARSLGQPPGSGYALLEPRPTSRFDTQTGFEAIAPSGLEVANEQHSRQKQDTVTGTRTTDIALPETQGERDEVQGIVNRKGPDGHTREATIPLRRPATPAVMPHSIDHITSPTAPIPAKAGDGLERTSATQNMPPTVNAMQPTEDALNEGDRATETPRRAPIEFTDVRKVDQSVRGATRQINSAAKQARELMQTVQPSISIGKIEVQFLPREPQQVPPPPAPRTRGFDGYARARRGERH
jgi:hypothetical protein